ncbi:MAG: hypothetical protein ACJAS4_002310 [Bacteriovoracaceae bacterium]|jgi:hypothetical protein
MFKGGVSSHFFNSHTRNLKISGWFLPSVNAYDNVLIFSSDNNIIARTTKSLYRYDAIKALAYEAPDALCAWEISVKIPEENSDFLKIKLENDGVIIHEVPFRITNFDKTEVIMKSSKDLISQKTFSTRYDFDNYLSETSETLNKQITESGLQLINKTLDFKSILQSYLSTNMIQNNKSDRILTIDLPANLAPTPNLNVKSINLPSNKVLTESERIFYYNEIRKDQRDIIHLNTSSPIFTQSELEYFFNIFDKGLIVGGRAFLQDLPIAQTSNYLVCPEKLEGIKNLAYEIPENKTHKVFSVSTETESIIIEYFTPQIINNIAKEFPNLSLEVIYYTNTKNIPSAPSYSLLVQKRA